MLAETVQQILEHHSRPIWRSREPTQSRMATRWGLRPSDGQRTPWPEEIICSTCEVVTTSGIGAEAPLGLVGRIEVSEAGTQDGRGNVDRVATGQPGREIAGLAAERGHRGAGADVDQFVICRAVHHAADRVFGPLAGGHQLGVALEDRRAAQAVLLFNQDTGLAKGGQRVRRGQPGRSAANDQDRFCHGVQPCSCLSLSESVSCRSRPVV